MDRQLWKDFKGESPPIGNVGSRDCNFKDKMKKRVMMRNH